MERTEAGGRLSRDELAESLLFYRRRLAGQIAREMIRAPGPKSVHGVHAVVQDAEDMANAICERLAARETGDPNGYK